jgi:hypothetical protein
LRPIERALWVRSKIREHGVAKSWRIVSNRANDFWNRWRHWSLTLSFYGNLLRLVFAPQHRRQRVLGIWDFKVLPWSVGDPLVFVEALSVLKLKHDADEVDICVVYDRSNPTGIRSSGPDGITPDNAQDYVLEFLPLFSTCPFLGSVYQFNSRQEFNRFLKANLWRYDVFPPLAEHLSESYNYIGGAPDIELIQDYFRDQGSIPHLRIGNRNESWAKWFYATNLRSGAIPVSLSLKRTVHDQIRNASPEAWLAFIDRCGVDFPDVMFVVVGLKDEAFEGLRKRPNVIVAKDFGTSLIEDMALIRTSMLYMCTTSGVNMIAWFSDQPYLQFQMPVPTFRRYRLEPGEMWAFMSKTQRIFSTEVTVTPELLFDEFKKLYSVLDPDEWHRVTAGAMNKSGHPSTHVVTSENSSISRMA